LGNERAKALEAQLKGYDKQIADDKLRIAKAEQSAAEAKRDAESQRLERVKLQKLVNPRMLDKAACPAIADELRPFANMFAGRKILVQSGPGISRRIYLL
jgi:hypothetical protein